MANEEPWDNPPQSAAQPAQRPTYGQAHPGQAYTPPHPEPAAAPAQKSKVVAGLLGIMLGVLGVHKFYLGYIKEGVIMLVASILGLFLTLGIASGVMSIIGLVEGILYLTKSDEEFYRTYEAGHKGWF